MVRKSLAVCWKIISRTVLATFLFICLYFIVAGICYCIPVNSDFVEPAEGIKIAVVSNGIHTDIVVPAKNEVCDWRVKFLSLDPKYSDTTFKCISFGWGSEEFFIKTRYWSDFKTTTALKAMLGIGNSAMHVEWKKQMPATGFRCSMITITKENYVALCNYILNSFENTADFFPHSIPQPLDATGYGDNDKFYRAKGTYNLFYSCNVWTGNGLKTAGVRVAVWTPFEKSVFGQLSQ